MPPSKTHRTSRNKPETRHDRPDTNALIKTLVDTPKRDNSAYHQAMAQARAAFEAAEAALGGTVQVKLKTKHKRNGEFVVKWVFRKG